MCQLIKKRYYCEHNPEVATWHPAKASDCDDAKNSANYDMNGQLLRCTIRLPL